jgi:hypothetical protein
VEHRVGPPQGLAEGREIAEVDLILVDAEGGQRLVSVARQTAHLTAALDQGPAQRLAEKPATAGHCYLHAVSLGAQ